MPGLASTMSWVLQVVDRGATVGITRYSRAVAGTIPATARFNAATRAARTDLRMFAMEAAVAGAMAAGIGMAMARSIRAFGKFEATSKATQLTLRPTTKEMGRLTEQARMLPGVLEFGPIALAEAQRELGQAGLSAAEVLGNLRPIADVATAGLIKMSDAVELGINLTRGFAVPVHETADAMDKLVRAAQLTPLSVENAGKALGFATGSARTFNQSLEDTVIALGLLIPITKTASKAGSSLSSSLQSIFRARGQRLLEGIGVSVRDAAGSPRSILDILLDLNHALKGVDKTQRQVLLSQILGVRGTQLYTAAVNAATQGSGRMAGTLVRGADAIKELRAQVGAANGTTAHFAREMRETYQKSVERYDAAVQSLSITLGEGFAPIPREAAQGMAPLVQEMNNFLRSMDGIPNKILAIGTAVTFVLASVRAATAAGAAFMTGRFLGQGSMLAGPAGALRSGLLNAAGIQALSARPGGGLLPSLPKFFGPAPITPIAGPPMQPEGFARNAAAEARRRTFAQVVGPQYKGMLSKKLARYDAQATLAAMAGRGEKLNGMDLATLSPAKMRALTEQITRENLARTEQQFMARPGARALFKEHLVDVFQEEAATRKFAAQQHWKLGRSVGRAGTATWNLAKSAGNLVGGFGVLMIATESVLFAFQQITATAEELYGADKRRLEVAEGLLPKLGLLPNFFAQAVAAGKAAGPGGTVRISEQFRDTMAELATSGIDMQEIVSIIFKAQQGQITDTMGALKEFQKTTAAAAQVIGSPAEKALDRVMAQLIAKEGVKAAFAGPSVDVSALGAQVDPASLRALTFVRAHRGDQSFWRDLFGMDPDAARTAGQLKAAGLLGAALTSLTIEITVEGKKQVVNADLQALVEGALAKSGRLVGQGGTGTTVRIISGGG